MRRFALVLAALVAASAPTLAFDAGSQAVIDRFKPGKMIPIGEVGSLMLGAERWCYNQRDEDCAWSDIYLSILENSVTYELSNPWAEDIDISFVAEAEFRSGRYICEIGFDWIPSVRAFERADGIAIEGRDLAALKDEMINLVDTSRNSACFDYLYESHDEAAQTITLTQRQFVDGVYQPDQDDVVTLHFDAETADNLGWYL